MRTIANKLAVVSALCFFAYTHIDTVQAASFDCAKASTRVEHMICDSPYLSQLDDELHAAYLELLQDKTQADKNRQSQRQWMKVRNACDDPNCVGNAYRSRQKEITALLEAAPGYKRKPRFNVTEGKGGAVCESYARYLNSLPESTPLPLCHIPRYPDFSDLKEPDWEVLDIQSNLELVYKLEKLTSPSYHDRPVDTFDHWKSVFEQQIKAGITSPRLRRTHLTLLDNGPMETILAYEPDQNKCDREMAKNGFAYNGALSKLYLWNENERKIEEYWSLLAFGIPYELLVFQGKPLLFYPYWGGGAYQHLTGEIDVKYFKKVGAEPYASLPRCRISFDLPTGIIERMTK